MENKDLEEKIRKIEGWKIEVVNKGLEKWKSLGIEMR